MSQDNPYASSDFDEALDNTGQYNELARRMLRLAAAIFDGIVGFLIMGPIMYFNGFYERSMAQAQGGPPISLGETLTYSAIGLVAFLVIHGYLLATRGQTVGKLVAGIQIVDYETNQLLPFRKLYLMRYLILSLTSIIPLAGPIIGLANVLFIFGGERRCLHDHLAGTKVIVKN